jgi:serine phosphatase RsbU (regulator of sigma subunit)
MDQARPGILGKILDFVLNIGADPGDDEYTRTIKRIFWVSACFGILAAFGSTLWYVLSGDAVTGRLFLFSLVLFVALFIDGIRHPSHFRSIATILLVFFVASSFLATVLHGGLWKTNGAIMVGLMGPLLGLVYFRSRRLAAGLFIVYGALVVTLAAVESRSGKRLPDVSALDPVKFWLGFIIVAAFIFGVIYFFVVHRDKAHRQLAEEKARSESLLSRIGADLEQAARIQRDLLPKKTPDLEGCDIAGINMPCYEIGGDYYDFIPIDGDRLGVVIADVSGKGISASLLMASLRAALLAEVRPDCVLERMAARLSDFVYASSGPSHFVTCFFGEVDRRTSELRYVNAGHNPPFILGRDGTRRDLESSGFPLGMFAGSTYRTGTVSLEPGELAVLYTDGISEGRNAQGEDYSDVRLAALVRESRRLGAAEICFKVLADVQDYACGTQPCDDITLVIVKRSAVTGAD